VVFLSTIKLFDAQASPADGVAGMKALWRAFS
jgi:hypothetical protein